MTLLPETMRDLFHVPGPGPYCLAHAAGAMPRATAVAMDAHYLKPWREEGSLAWGPWLEHVEGFRASLAPLVGGLARELCPKVNVSAAFEHYLGAIPREKGRNIILMSEQTFPTLGFVAQGMEAFGFEFRLLPQGADPGDPQVWADAIDERTAVALVMHVHSNTGQIGPVAEIAALAKAKGARTVVDVAQSAGVVPVTLRDWGVDAGVGSCLKWLSGGAGAGWLWVPEAEFDGLKPASLGWFSHAEPFEMDIRDFRYAKDALRFWGGSPDVAPFIAAKVGADTVAGIGIAQIAAHNKALQRAFRELVEPRRPHWGWPTHAIGGTICIDLGEERGAVEQLLAAQQVRVDYRGTILRLSFASWNSLSEVNALAALLST